MCSWLPQRAQAKTTGCFEQQRQRLQLQTGAFSQRTFDTPTVKRAQAISNRTAQGVSPFEALQSPSLGKFSYLCTCMPGQGSPAPASLLHFTMKASQDTSRLACMLIKGTQQPFPFELCFCKLLIWLRLHHNSSADPDRNMLLIKHRCSDHNVEIECTID